MGFASLGCGFVARPSGDFAPAGDLLSERPESRQRVAPAPSPLFEGCLAMLGARGPRRTPFATLRSNSCAESVLEVRFAHASGSCASRLLQRGVKEQANSQQPNPESGWRMYFCVPPFSPAEERKTRSPRAQLASRTDSRRLFEQSVAARVRRGASGLSTAGDPQRSEGRGGQGGAFCLLFGGPKSESPAGANSRLGPSTKGGAS